MAKIKQTFARDEISRLIDVKTIHMSPTDILITAKVDIKSEFESQSSSIINDIEKQIRKTLPDYKSYIYIEEDKYVENYQRTT